ncbi:MAG: hypothetical protein NC093_00560 [Alistipes sp.]|nr:hypothetical protein [Alistipes sp.]
MEEFNSNTPVESVETDSVSGVEPAKKKKKAPIIAGIAAGVVALGAGGGIAAYNLSDAFKNTVKLNFSKPESYYSWVIEKNSSDFAANAKNGYKESLEQSNDGATSSVSLRYEISDDVRQLLLDEIGTEDAAVVDMVNSIESAKIGIDMETVEKLLSGSVYADLNDERLTTLDLAMDMEKFDIFGRIPDLTEQWLYLDIPEDELSDLTGDDSMSAMEEMLSDPEKLISAEELEELINRYSAVWANSVEDVEIEKKADVDIAGLDVTYTIAAVELDDKLMEEIATALVETIQDDDLVKEIVCDRLQAVTEDEFDDAMDEALGDMNFEGVDGIVETYIDGDGSVKGLRIEAEDDEILFVFGEDKDEYAFEMVISEDKTDILAVEANFEEDGKKYSGDIDLTFDNVTVTFEVRNCEVVDEEKGYFNGEFTIEIPSIDPITIECESDGESQTIATELVVDGLNLGKFAIEVSAEEGGNPEMPSKDDAFVIDENSTPDFTQYVDQASVESFISNILTKLGTDKAEADELAAYLADDMFNPVSYDDYDYDYDYDYDDDDYDFDNDNDYQYSYDDEYAADAVAPEDGQAYVYVYDMDFNAYYLGYNDDTMAYNAVLADVTKDGTYKVSVTSDTDGYRQWCDELPNGIDVLALTIDGVPGIGDAEVVIDSVTFTMEDGKKQTVEMTGEDDGFGYEDYYMSYLYMDGEDSAYDLSSIKTWVAVEIEFTVKGLK